MDLNTHETKVYYTSLNQTDAFILQLRTKIYVWFGEKCPPLTRNEALMKSIAFAKDQGTKTLETEIDDDFWEAIGGKPDEIAANSAAAGGGALANPSAGERHGSVRSAPASALAAPNGGGGEKKSPRTSSTPSFAKGGAAKANAPAGQA